MSLSGDKMNKSKCDVYDFTTSNLKIPEWWAKPDMEFGHFSKNGREYVITNPETPRPWLNYMGNKDYGLVFGNHGEGYSWYRSMTARVTRYTSKEYVPRDPDSGRAVYLKLGNDKSIISLASLPNQSFYKCTHGLGYSMIEGQYSEIGMRWKIFVPAEDPVEIWQVSLVNNSDMVKDLEIMPVVEWHLGVYSYSPPLKYSSVTDFRKDLKAAFVTELNAVVVENTAPQSLKYSAFFKSINQIDKWQCRREALSGDNLLNLKNIKLTNENASNEPVVSAVGLNVTLEPGEEKSFVFVGGVFNEQSQLKNLISKYDTAASVDRALCEIEKYWDRIIYETTYIQTPSKEVDLWYNIRLKYLLHNTKKWTRGLDKGYRDVLQDLRGYIIVDPNEVKKCLLKTLSYQYCDGRAIRQISAIGDCHDLRDYADSPVWIADVLTMYIKETGDSSILEENVKYFDCGSGTVYEHALQGLWQLYNDRGQHGLCKIRYGDWNDALEGIGKNGRAEGIWLTMALYWAMGLMKELAEYIKDDDNVCKLSDAMDIIKKLVNQHGWTGQWYAYAIDDDGGMVGSPSNPEGKLHLNAQTFAVFTGIAEGNRAILCRDAIKKHLMTEVGPLLIWPVYKNSKVGRMWRLEPGNFENGSIYTHGASFKIYADLVGNDPDGALDTLLKILPSNPLNPLSRSTSEPYSLGNYYCGRDNKFFGLNVYSHFTGSYPWLMKCIAEKMIGVEACYDGLKISPNLPTNWDTVKIKKRYRDSVYNITIKRSKTNKSTYDIFSDGVLICQSSKKVFINNNSKESCLPESLMA